MIEIRMVAIEKLRPNDRNARTHLRKQIRQIADDVAIRRWQAFSRKDAIHMASGRCFDEITADTIKSAADPIVVAA
jgi:hypothetical protein